METNYEINQLLLDECLKEKPNYFEIEGLLKNGAKPLSTVKRNANWESIVYCDIVDQYIDYNFDSEVFPKVTELFLQYGMDVSKPEVPYDECEETHPLWMFAFYSGRNALKTLRLLLDYGLDVESASECWNHILCDYYNVWGALEDEFCYEMLYDAIRKIMLIASYPHILQNDEDLQDVIWLKQNNYPIESFRNWDDFVYEIDSSYWGNETPRVYKSVVTIVEKRTGKKAWKFGFGVKCSWVVVKFFGCIFECFTVIIYLHYYLLT